MWDRWSKVMIKSYPGLFSPHTSMTRQNRLGMVPFMKRTANCYGYYPNRILKKIRWERDLRAFTDLTFWAKWECSLPFHNDRFWGIFHGNPPHPHKNWGCARTISHWPNTPKKLIRREGGGRLCKQNLNWLGWVGWAANGTYRDHLCVL